MSTPRRLDYKRKWMKKKREHDKIFKSLQYNESDSHLNDINCQTGNNIHNNCIENISDDDSELLDDSTILQDEVQTHETQVHIPYTQGWKGFKKPKLGF